MARKNVFAVVSLLCRYFAALAAAVCGACAEPDGEPLDAAASEAAPFDAAALGTAGAPGLTAEALSAKSPDTKKEPGRRHRMLERPGEVRRWKGEAFG